MQTVAAYLTRDRSMHYELDKLSFIYAIALESLQSYDF